MGWRRAEQEMMTTNLARSEIEGKKWRNNSDSCTENRRLFTGSAAGKLQQHL